MHSEDSHHFPDPIRARALRVDARMQGMEGSLFLGQNGSQIVFWECTAEADVPAHSHDYDEYCVVIEGVCTEIIDGVEHRLEKGDEILIPAGAVHSGKIFPPYRAIDYFGGPRFRYENRD